MSLRALDAICLNYIVAGYPATLSKDGVDVTCTASSRKTRKDFGDGGFISGQEITALVPVSAFGTGTPFTEKDAVTLCVDSFGVPCVRSSGSTDISCRIISVDRSLAGITYLLKEANR